MADSGEWKCFHDITHESQRALAEMNEALGSLRQWRKQRKVDSSSSAPTTAIGEQLLSSVQNLSAPLDCYSEPTTTLTRDRRNSSGANTDGCGQDNVLDKDSLDAEQDPLLVPWQVTMGS